MRSRLRRACLVAVFSLLLCVPLARAVECKWLKSDYPDPAQNAYCFGTRWGHVFYAADDEPFATALRATGGLKSISDLTIALAKLGERAKEKRDEEYLLSECGNPTINPYKDQQGITKEQADWTHSSEASYVPHQLAPRVSNCFTSLRLNMTESRRYISLMNDYFRAQNASLKKVSLPILDEWAGVHIIDGRKVDSSDRGVFRCTLWNSAASRVASNGTEWATILRVTNAPKEETLPEDMRLYATEMIDKFGHGVRHKMYRENMLRSPQINGTTKFARWAGFAGAHFGRQDPSDSPAIREAAKATMLRREIVGDTVAPSNIAILALPLFMTLVPISCVESVTTPVIFVYALLTDVLSVVPLAIKGIELLVIARARYSVCDAWMAGVESDVGGASLEVWCATCDARSDFMSYGATLLGIALFFLVVGIAAEIIARKRLHNQMKKYDGDVPSWWALPIISRLRKLGSGAHTETHAFCQECNCRRSPDKANPVV